MVPMLKPDNGNRPPEEAMTERCRLVRELFVNFDHMPGLTPESLIGLEEAIHGHLECRPSAEEHERFMHDMLDEVPGLGRIIEGTEDTGNISVLNILTRIANGETNLPVRPLSAHRFRRQEEILRAL